MNCNWKRNARAAGGLLLAGIIAGGLIIGAMGMCTNPKPPVKPMYMAQIDAQTVLEHGSDAVVEDLIKGGVNTAALQVYPDEGENGVYWNSSLAPMNKDVLSTFIDNAHERNLSVWAWMTTLDMPWVYEKHPDWRVKAYINGTYTEDTGWYQRISPFVVENDAYIVSLYKEIARKYNIDGFLLQDDLYLSKEEGFDEASKIAFEHDFGKKLTPDMLNSDSEISEFCDWKANQLSLLVKEIKSEVKGINPRLKVAVNVYPETVTLEPGNEICENFSDITNNADYAAVMAYQKLDPIHPLDWVGEVTKIAVQKVGPGKVILKIQGTDWHNDQKLPDDEIKGALDLARKNGAENFGIYLFDYNMSDYGIKF